MESPAARAVASMRPWRLDATMTMTGKTSASSTRALKVNVSRRVSATSSSTLAGISGTRPPHKRRCSLDPLWLLSR